MLAQIEERIDGPLTIRQTRYGDDVLVFALIGEFDLAVVETGREVLGQALAEPGGMVVVDLTELEFIDSSGVALLYELARARADTDSLRLLPSRHGNVNRVLELTAVHTVIPTVGTG